MLCRWGMLPVFAIAAASISPIPCSGKGLPHLLAWSYLKLRGGGSTNEEGYSFSLTTFSPRGRLNQIEYAMNSALEGALSVAVKYECSDSGCGGIAVASLRKPGSPLIVELLGTRKIAKVADGVVVLHSGLAADSRVLLRRAQECCLEYQAKFEGRDAMPLDTLASEVALMMQEYTHMAGVRPFGVTLLIAGVGIDGMSQIHRVEPSGTCTSWKACAIGKGSRKAEQVLRDQVTESLDRDSALEMVLSTVVQCSTSARKQDVDIAFVEEGVVNTLNALDVNKLPLR